MAEKISKMIIEVGGTDYELAGGGSTPAPESVDSESIKDGSITMDDLNEEVVEQLENATDDDIDSIFD